MNTKKRVEEDMVMSVPPEGSGGMPGGFHNVPAMDPGSMDTFSLLGPGGTGKSKKRKRRRKNKNKTGTPGYILSFDQFFKGRKKNK